MKLVRDCMQFAVRIPRQIKHCGDGILPLLRRGRGIHSTLIISPPGAGKTTLLRELSRLLSEEGRNVCIIDERSEIACLDRGISPFDLGPHTDILDHCPKREGMRKMLRVMAPEVLVTDEIGDEGDAAAICEAVASGVTVLASIHGSEVARVRGKGAFERLWRERSFGRYVLLSAQPRPGTVAGICDAEGKALKEGVA
jgi:stage III sporulation protein AA